MRIIYSYFKAHYASSWIRTSGVFSERDYESRAIVHSAINAQTSILNFLSYP